MLAVVLTHAAGDDYGLIWGYYGLHAWIVPFGRGAVNFFFALSGFIIPYVYNNEGVREYLRRRFIRIFPTYWLVNFALLAAGLMIPALGALPQYQPWNLLASFLILPQPQMPLLPLAWTLEHELVFYALFAVWIWRPLIGTLGFMLWAICIGCSVGPDVIINRHNIFFFIGLFLALVVRWHSTRVILFLEQLSWPRFMVAFGDASYAIYLVHLPALLLWSKILRYMGFSAMGAVIFAILSLLAVSTGVAFHIVVEKPLLRRLRRLAIGRTRELAQSG